MANPFLRRATEYVRDDTSFLAIVSPAPLTTFLAKNEHKDEIFEFPVRIIGTPGSGKTMLATLAEFKMVEAILRDPTNATNRDLAAALADAGFLDNGKPKVAAVRVPMESEYRDFWELPYDASVKAKLVFWLVQARAILGLIRNLTANKTRTIDEIRFIPRAAYEAHLEQIGGLTGSGIQSRALDVQKAIYSVGAGLRPPKLVALPKDATAPYAPFDAIKRIEIDWYGETLSLNPLVMLDDVHALHHEQLKMMFKTLSHREMKFGRWMMMRLDALSPDAVLQKPGTHDTHDRSKTRDFIDIKMQGHSKKVTERRQFRTMAVDMADRYLPSVLALKNRNATSFARLLSGEAPQLSSAKLKELEVLATRDQEKLNISYSRKSEIDKLIRNYLKNAKSYDRAEEVTLQMSRILMNRYSIRRSKLTPDLFEETDPDVKVPLKADSDVAEGARVQLNHQFERPLHFGINDLCDMSNENAEIFLQYAGALVASIETRAIRNQDLTINAKTQEKILFEKAQSIMNGWAFPHAASVRSMVDKIGIECIQKSLLPNAPLGYGANAIAIPESEMPDLAGEDNASIVLKQAIANGAVNIERNYGQGGKLWCLIELTGTVNVVHRLTFKRGGFLEKNLDYLREITV